MTTEDFTERASRLRNQTAIRLTLLVVALVAEGTEGPARELALCQALGVSSEELWVAIAEMRRVGIVLEAGWLQ